MLRLGFVCFILSLGGGELVDLEACGECLTRPRIRVAALRALLVHICAQYLQVLELFDVERLPGEKGVITPRIVHTAARCVRLRRGGATVEARVPS